MSKDKLAQTLLKHWNSILLVGVFPKEVLNNKRVQNRSGVILQQLMDQPKINLYKSAGFVKQTHISQHDLKS